MNIEVDHHIMENGNVTDFLTSLEDGGISRVFSDCTPVAGDIYAANRNAIEAAKHALDLLGKEGTLLVAMGPMASSKSTMVAEIAGLLGNEGRPVEIYKHTIENRGVETHRKLWLQSWTVPEGITTDIDVRLYNDLSDLLVGENEIRWMDDGIQIIDEIMFAGKGDPPKVESDILFELIYRARKHNSKLVVTGLHSDYRAKLWPNMKLLLPLANLGVIELQGRCSYGDCPEPSRLTMRQVPVVDDGKIVAHRPSHLSEKIVRVGPVATNQKDHATDRYVPVCPRHHHVWTPDQARRFDHKYGLDMGDYGN